MTSLPICRRRRLTLMAAMAVLGTAPARATVAGGKTVTLVVSYPPGGGADLVARLIAPGMSQSLGQPVVVENRAGAGGLVAGAFVAKARPDGATLFLDASNYAVAPSLYRMPYDPASAFTAIGVAALFPNVLVAHPAFDAKTVPELLALARSQPGAVAFASSGNGSAQHLAGELFEDSAKVSLIRMRVKPLRSRGGRKAPCVHLGAHTNELGLTHERSDL